MKSITRSKKQAAPIFLFLAALFFSFLIFEIGCRLFKVGEVPQEKAVAIRHTHYNPFLIFGPNIDKKFPQKNAQDAYFNAQGFRQNELLTLEKSKAEYRVFALGGSTTENIPNGNNQHYCGAANELFANEKMNGKTFHCINAAKSGFSSAHSLIRLQFDLLSYQPDMITVMDHLNDLTVNFFPFDGRYNYGNKYLHPVYAPPFSDLKRSFLRKSRVCVLFYKKGMEIKDVLFGKKLFLEDGRVVISKMRFNSLPTKLIFKETFRNNLISIASIAKAHHIRPVFLTQPASFSEARYALTFSGEIHGLTYPPLEEFKKLFEEYNEVVKEVAHAEDAGLIDMYELLGHEPRYFTDMVHYSAEGIARFAEIYVQELKKMRAVS